VPPHHGCKSASGHAADRVDERALTHRLDGRSRGCLDRCEFPQTCQGPWVHPWIVNPSSVDATSVGEHRLATSMGERTVEPEKRWRKYFWPAITAFLVSVPLWTFRDEDSVLHVIFRVAWLAVLVLSLVAIGRQAFRDLRGRRLPAGRVEGSPGADQ
jgi:hypothetical protein